MSEAALNQDNAPNEPANDDAAPNPLVSDEVRRTDEAAENILAVLDEIITKHELSLAMLTHAMLTALITIVDSTIEENSEEELARDDMVRVSSATVYVMQGIRNIGLAALNTLMDAKAVKDGDVTVN